MRFKQPAIIEFPVAENVEPVDIRRRLLCVYGNETLDIGSASRWIFVPIEGRQQGKSELFPIRIDMNGRGSQIKKLTIWSSQIGELSKIIFHQLYSDFRKT